MTLQEYEEFTKRTARGLYNKDFSDKNLFLIFLALGMAGEAGEVANKVKKYMRGDGYDKKEILLEIGDVLWYISGLCYEMGATMEEVLALNVSKLIERHNIPTIPAKK